MTRRVYVMGFPKTGSSLLASLVAAHDYYVGPTTGKKEWTDGEYEAFEHVVTEGVLQPHQFNAEAFVQEMDRHGDWVFKGMPRKFWPRLAGLVDTVLVSCRDRDALMRSRRDKGPGRVDEGQQFIVSAAWEYGAIFVPMMPIIDGDYRMLGQALAACGRVINTDLVKQTVEPDKWHYR